MEIDKDKVRKQEDLDEPAPMDQVGQRVEAEMKLIEGKAKEQVAHGLQDEELEREANRLKEEGERELKSVNDSEAEKKNS